MRARLGALALALALATACHAQVNVTKKPAATASKAAAASALPSAVATAAAGALPPALLRQPASGTSALSGQVQVDASYLISDHGGGLLSNNAGNVVVAGGSLISDHGASIVSDHGGGIISNNSGAIVAAPGGNVISDQGGSLLSDQGGGLIGNHSAGIVSDHGGGLVGKVPGQAAGLVGKVPGYRLMADDAPAFGAELPAVGMRVVVVDPVTNLLVPLGEDAAGQPVYAIYSDARGAFTVYLPDVVANAVRVVAVVPDSTEARLGYNVFAKPSSAAAIDEERGSTTQLVREGLATRFTNLLVLNDTQGSGGLPSDELVDKLFGQARAPVEIRGLLGGVIKDLFVAMAANPRITSKDYVAVGLAMGDLLLARADDLEAIKLDPTYFGNAERQAAIASAPYAHAPAFAQLRTVLSALRDRVVAVGGDPAHCEATFAGKPYLQRANQFHARLFPKDPAPYYAIRKPADMIDFLTREYFGLVPHSPYGCAEGDCPATTPATCNILDGCIPESGVPLLDNAMIFALPKLVLTDLGLPADEDVGIVNAVGNAVIFTVGAELLNEDVHAEVVSLIQHWGETP